MKGSVLCPALPFRLPSPPGYSAAPEWTGSGFRVGDNVLPVVSYSISESGWNDELVDFSQGESRENHYINRASRNFVLSRFARWITADQPVLGDIGCSSGFLVKDLQRQFPSATIIGADYLRQPLEQLASAIPDVPFIQFDITRCPLPDACFDGIAFLNVLEHIEDDRLALTQLRRLLKPSAVAVIEVPAGSHLYDIYDRQLLHFRRYDAKGFFPMLSECGFELLERSHLGFFLYPAFSMVKRKNRRKLSEPDDVQKAIVSKSIENYSENPLMHGVMRLEAALRDWISYPFGIRCLAVCRRQP